MKQKFSSSLLKAVIEYNHAHGDVEVKPIRFVCNPMGEPLLLIRAKCNNGKRYSCLDSYKRENDKWVISEEHWVESMDERVMLKAYTEMSED